MKNASERNLIENVKMKILDEQYSMTMLTLMQTTTASKNFFIQNFYAFYRF